MEFLLSLSANIDWHIIIYVLSQSPEKVMIFLFILMFSSPWLPFLEPVFTPTTFHPKEKKPEKIHVFYKVLCSSSYLLSLIFMSAIIKHTCILEILLSLCNKCLLEWTSIKFNNESSKLSFPPVCVYVWWKVARVKFFRGCWYRKVKMIHLARFDSTCCFNQLSDRHLCVHSSNAYPS